tara:strand:- start:4490 stop:4927 length:438 start_codon:yes stop_codon:yes gene_type:complete
VKERIENIIMKKNWTLSDILDIESSIGNVVQEVIMDITIEEKYYLAENVEFIRDEYPEEITMGHIISMVVRERLTVIAKQVFNEHLKTAKVNFNDNVDEKQSTKPKTVLEPVPESTEDKIKTLKQKIREDSKQLNQEEKKDLGMV